MRGLLGDEADDFEQSLETAPVTGLRVNTLKISPLEFERISPWPLEPVPWCSSGYIVPARERPGLHPFHAAGLYYLQEPSAMAVAGGLAPRPFERVLDLAAAPGGKSTHLAALLGNDGLLVANDVNAPRARELSRNIERWGTRRTVITSATPELLARTWGGVFDAVLLDAPCSGEGMFRKTPEALEQWSEELVASCAARQGVLLEEAARLVKPGGRLAYSTCTFAPDENERLVARFLESHDDWALVPLALPGAASGRSEWVPEWDRASELAGTVRLWPHHGPGEGHFVALLCRSVDSPVDGEPTGPSPRRRAKGDRRTSDAELQNAVSLWHTFAERNLLGEPFTGHELHLRDDGLYALPPGSPALEGIRVLRPGTWLGKVERGRFAPSHSLALTLREDEAARSVDLGANDPRLLSYLEGAELEVAGEDGWLLVTVAGHPLGWGRRARDIIKNHYPKGLRLRP